MTRPPTSPVVLLVGGGPGDPDLLTLRAEAALAAAATVVTDRALEGLATAFALRAVVVSVGSAPEAVAALRRAAPPVVRLYRGDPWLHVDYGAEVAALAAAGVAIDAVPGVSVEIGLATEAGLALHHRREAVVATLFSGQVWSGSRTKVDQRIVAPVLGDGHG